MNGTMSLYLAACLCLGAGALALATACAARSGRRELRYFLAYLGALIALVASNLVLFELDSPAPAGLGGISPLMYSLMTLNMCLTVALSLSGSLIAQAILDVPWRVPGSIVACAVSIGSLTARILQPMTRYDAAARSVAFLSGPDLAMIASLANVAYALGLLLFFRSRIPEARVRRLTLAFFAMSALFSPGIAYDILASRDLSLLSALPTKPAFFPLYLAALSMAVSYFAYRYLASGPAKAAPRPPEDDLTAALAAEQGLTARESEIMALVARGLSNKQIAWELGISDRTVGNHIYSLYRKIGINSRFELMGILHGRAAEGGRG